MKKIAAAMQAGKAISDPEVQKLMDQSRAFISQFYDCSTQMFRNLADMYIQDPRFTATYEKYAKGMAQYVRDAIHYYCDQAEGEGKL